MAARPARRPRLHDPNAPVNLNELAPRNFPRDDIPDDWNDEYDDRSRSVRLAGRRIPAEHVGDMHKYHFGYRGRGWGLHANRIRKTWRECRCPQHQQMIAETNDTLWHDPSHEQMWIADILNEIMERDINDYYMNDLKPEDRAQPFEDDE